MTQFDQNALCSTGIYLAPVDNAAVKGDRPAKCMLQAETDRQHESYYCASGNTTFKRQRCGGNSPQERLSFAVLTITAALQKPNSVLSQR